jgi:hypothetical protein
MFSVLIENRRIISWNKQHFLAWLSQHFVSRYFSASAANSGEDDAAGREHPSSLSHFSEFLPPTNLKKIKRRKRTSALF